MPSPTLYQPRFLTLAFLPASLVMGTLSLGFSERLIMGVGPQRALVAGLVCACGGLLLFARAPVDGNYVTDVLPVMLLLGGVLWLALALKIAFATRHRQLPSL